MTKEKQQDQPQARGLRFVGFGYFIPGVPARDLTPEEAAIHGPKIAEVERNMGYKLYETAGDSD